MTVVVDRLTIDTSTPGIIQLFEGEQYICLGEEALIVLSGCIDHKLRQIGDERAHSGVPVQDPVCKPDLRTLRDTVKTAPIDSVTGLPEGVQLTPDGRYIAEIPLYPTDRSGGMVVGTQEH